MADEDWGQNDPVASPAAQDWGANDPVVSEDRGALQRAGEAAAGTFQSGLEAGKKLFMSRTKEEAEEGYGVTGALKGLKETGLGLLSPVTMAVGAPMAGAESLIASGMGALQRGAQRGITAGIEQFAPEKAAQLREKIPTSEEAYKTWEPNVRTAMQALGTRPGFSALTAAESIPKDLSRAIVRDADTPAALNQRLAEARKIRPEATLADVGGENVRGVVERVAQTPGAGRTTIVPHLEARQKAQMSRIADDLTAATGTRQTAFRAIEDSMEARKTAAVPLYERAYAEGSEAIWSPELERLSSAPFVQSAMRRAVSGWKNNAIADGYGAMNPSNVDRGGILTFGKSVPVFPDLQFWDYTKQQLDGMTSAALRAGQNQKARTLTRLTQQLRAGLDGHPQVPVTYTEARNAWSGPSRYIDSIEDGRSIFNRNITAEEFTHNFNALTEAEKEGMRIGIVGAIRQKMAANPAKMPDLTRELRSEDMRAKMAAIMPTPEAAEKFNRALDYEIKSSELAHRSLAGSQTYRRLMEKVDAENIFGEAALHILAPHHSMRGMFLNLFRTLSKPVRDTLRSRMDARSAELLTGTSEIPITGKTPMRQLPLYAPLAGSATVENPKGFKKGGRVTKTFRYGGSIQKLQGGGPAGPGGGGGDQPISAPPDMAINYTSVPAGNFIQTSAPGASDPGGGLPSISQPGTPSIEDPRQVASESGLTLGQLAGSLLPQGSPGNYAYKLPSDQGGYFTLKDLYATTQRPTVAPGAMGARGQPTVSMQGAGVPQIMSYGQDQPSTNNWRLLGQGPGWIMRNGFLINTRDPAVMFGFPAGADTSPAAEGGSYAHRQIALGTGTPYGLPGWYGGNTSGGWPGATTWPTFWGPAGTAV